MNIFKSAIFAGICIGIAGFVNDGKDIADLLVILAGNLVGCNLYRLLIKPEI